MFSFFSVQFLNKEVFIQVIDGAGHHVYADQKDEFNALVLRKCEETDPAGVGHR
jgi:pimeloyl-ACP methyl ester carboxylesterase